MATKPLACWICGSVVDLNTCITDEHGLPVHEPCYVSRTILKSKSMQLDATENSNAPGPKVVAPVHPRSGAKSE